MATATLRSAPLERTLSGIMTLAGVLAHLEIAVFPTVQVEEYKKQYRRSLLQKRLMTEIMPQTLVLAIMGGLCLWAGYGHPQSATGAVGLGLLWIAAVGFGVSAVYFPISTWKSLARVVDWRETPSLANIPDEAVPDVIAIRDMRPSARFSVEYLDQDPFLWVYDEGGERYCVCHWDEPEFVDR